MKVLDNDVVIYYEWPSESIYQKALTDGGDGCDDFAEFELVQDGGFSSSIEPDHKNPHLTLAEQAIE